MQEKQETEVEKQAKEISPFFFEQLYEDLGRPRWFWPLVFVAMFVLWGLAGATEF